MKEKILQALIENNTYISGETLSHQFGVSRTAIWKAINKLKDEGFEITSTRNKGYLLTKESEALNAEGIKVHLGMTTRFKHVKVYDSVDSTITEAKRLKINDVYDEALILAHVQTAGKGRRGRSWVSAKGDGIWSSLLLAPDIAPSKAPMLTLIAGLAVCRAIKDQTALEAQIKWPNDVVIKGRKVCGILTEMSAQRDYIEYVIVGIGINVNQLEFGEDIADIASSLRLLSGLEVNQMTLLVRMIEEFEMLYNTFIKEQSLDFMIQDYNDACINIGMELKIEAYGKTQYGVGIKVSNDGQLMVKDKNNDIFEVNAGEVSVRGLYGYVD